MLAGNTTSFGITDGLQAIRVGSDALAAPAMLGGP